MNFWKAYEEMRNGKRVALPELPKNCWIERGQVTTFGTPYWDIILVKSPSKWESLKLCDRLLRSEDWILYETDEDIEWFVQPMIPRIIYPVVCSRCNKAITTFETMNHEGEKICCPGCGFKIKLTYGGRSN